MRKEFLLCLILLLAVFAKAQTPNTISFQGNLTTPGTSNPIADGSYSMDFALFDADIAGVSLWSETQPAVTVSEGLINVQLGSVTPLEISDFYQPVYLEITIQSETLSPRIALLAVPYAQTAKAVVGTDSILFRMLDQKAGIVDQTNTALGYFSFTQEQGSGFFNQAIGNSALQQNNGGSQNVAVGSFALENNTTGATNIAIGYNALNANTISSNNVALGPYSLQSNTDGIENVAAGPNALGANTTGNQNIGIGLGALTTNTIGTGNVGVGVDALNLNLDGNENTAVGVFALEKSTGLGNTAIGGNALRPLATGNYNVAIGYNTGSNAVGVEHVNGTYNTLIGTDASVGVDGLNNASAIGFGAVVSQSNSLVLGNADVNVGIGTSTPGEKLSVVGNVHASDSVKADVFAYNTPKTGFASVHSSGFSPSMSGNTYYVESSSSGFHRNVNGGVLGTTVTLNAPIHFPHGAVIKELRIRVFDSNASYDCYAQLIASGTTGQTENLITTTNTSVDGGGQVLVGNTINPSFAEVDNFDFSYSVRLYFPSGNLSIYYYSASVEYELSQE